MRVVRSQKPPHDDTTRYRTATKTGKFSQPKMSGQDWKRRGNEKLFGTAGDGGRGGVGRAATAGNGDDDDEPSEREIDWAAQ